MENNKPMWVRLHLAKGASEVTMPEEVTGLLLMETEDKYSLGSMVGYQRTPTGITEVFMEGMNFINKSFVWRLEQLIRQPELNSQGEDNDLETGEFSGLG